MNPQRVLFGAQLALAMTLPVGTVGCVYSVQFDPPRQGHATAVSRHPALDLTLSVEDDKLFVNGKAAPTSGEGDVVFVQRAQVAHLTKATLSQGSQTDLYLSTETYVDDGGTPSIARGLYRAAAFFPALIVPGVPYPWELHLRQRFRVRGKIGKESVTIGEYTGEYDMTVWLNTYWGASFGSTHQVDNEWADYQIDFIADAFDRDYEAFDQFQVAAKKGQKALQAGVDASRNSAPSLEAAVVRINSDRAVGSGFFVTENLIATNAHVVRGSPEVRVSLSGGAESQAPVVYADEDLDFALVRSSVQGTPLPIRSTPLSDGERVLAVGFPQGRRVVAGSTGTVRKIVECCVEHDALVAGGSSGGPLVDSNSNVIGINTLLVKAKGDQKNERDRTWALKMNYILESLPQPNGK